jgi:carbonic anhydrase/acetyltransferase-like protein (isoleucine patch superfamily)
MAIYQLGDRVPEIHPSAYVHETATVIGRVRLGAGVNIWPYATLRGDNEPIVVDDGSNIQESSTLHTDPGVPLTIGRNVTVGHHVMLHGCTIGDGSLIGIQTVVLNRAVVGRNVLVGACSLVTEGKTFADGQLVMGSPARVIRELSAEEIARMHANTASYVVRGAEYRTQLRRIG